MSTIEPLLERFRRRDRTALARLLTLIARGEQREAIRAALPRDPGPSRVVAVTGNGGVGKSTLIGKLIDVMRGRGRTVAVLACDPESPLTGRPSWAIASACPATPTIPASSSAA